VGNKEGCPLTEDDKQGEGYSRLRKTPQIICLCTEYTEAFSPVVRIWTPQLDVCVKYKTSEYNMWTGDVHSLVMAILAQLAEDGGTCFPPFTLSTPSTLELRRLPSPPQQS
jgi:hypothetical protein